MVIIVTLMLTSAIFLFVRELQLKRLQAETAKMLLFSAVERNNSFRFIKSKTIKLIAKAVKKLPLSALRVAETKKLLEARAENDFTADEFISYRLLLGFVGLFAYMLLFSSLDFTALGVFGVMVLLPQFELKEKREKYDKELLRSLPPALDLITVCVEAGLTFDGSVQKYIQKTGKNVLRTEFEQYMRDMAFGRSRAEALKIMADRINIREFSSFSAAIQQSERLGTSIGGILRLQNQQIRVKRTQRIEKLAAQAPVKLMLPLVLFILPVVFIVILGPIALKLMAQFR